MSHSSSLTRRGAASSRHSSSLNDGGDSAPFTVDSSSIPRGGDAAASKVPTLSKATSFGMKQNDNDHSPFSFVIGNVTMAALPTWTGLCLKTVLGMTVALYVLNQKHALPKPLSAVVSKALFWPTLPITVSRRIGTWTTVVDKTVVMGGAPFGFLGFPERLYQDYGVSL